MNKKLATLATIITLSPIVIAIFYIIHAENYWEAIANVSIILAIVIIGIPILYFVAAGVALLYNRWLIYFNKKFPK